LDPKRLQDLFNPMTYRHYLAADRYSKLDVYDMMECNNITTRAFGKLMLRYDVLLTPTHAIRVPQANGPYALLRDEELDPWVTKLSEACRYTMPSNETGLPGVSLPAGFDSDGLPIGIQVHGNFAAEDTLLQIAAQIERARPQWFGATSPVHVTTGD
jgi:amidase